MPRAPRSNPGAAQVISRGWVHGLLLGAARIEKRFVGANGKSHTFGGRVARWHRPSFRIRYEDCDPEELTGWELARHLCF